MGSAVKKTQVLSVGSTEKLSELNASLTEQGRNYSINVVTKFTENVAELKYSGLMQITVSFMKKLTSGNACCHSVQHIISLFLSVPRESFSTTVGSS
jgi:hypothetical protein